jgi:hypothetical protein
MPGDLKIEFNIVGQLILMNNHKEQLPFVLIYERTERGPHIWWRGEIAPSQSRIVARPTNTILTEADALDEFHQALQREGLYDDEATAMLQTWQESYFNTSGLKVFWIYPRATVDDKLPLSLTPLPTSLERVMVGRSEILTPERESQLYEEYLAGTLLQNYQDDRFLQAYLELVKRMDTSTFQYSSEHLDLDRSRLLEFISIRPNPTLDATTIAMAAVEPVELELSILDSWGAEIKSTLLSLSPGQYSLEVDLSGQPAGMYVARITTMEGSEVYRVVKL